MPPPAPTALLAVIVQFVTVRVPVFSTPPPLTAPPLVIVQADKVRLPALPMLPPYLPCPPVMVSREIATVPAVMLNTAAPFAALIHWTTIFCCPPVDRQIFANCQPSGGNRPCMSARIISGITR